MGLIFGLTGGKVWFMRNVGAYFEIPVRDLERAMGFYASLCGCTFERGEIHGNDMAFFPFAEGEPGVMGALAKGETYVPSLQGSLIYLDTKDLDASLKKLAELRAEILFPRTEVPGGYGWVAEFKDSEGNRVALFQRSWGDGK